eukprot:3814089-Prymnesium_polylepis.1
MSTFSESSEPAWSRMREPSCSEKMRRCRSKRPRVTYAKHVNVAESSSESQRAARPSFGSALRRLLLKMKLKAPASNRSTPRAASERAGGLRGQEGGGRVRGAAPRS